MCVYVCVCLQVLLNQFLHSPIFFDLCWRILRILPLNQKTRRCHAQHAGVFTTPMRIIDFVCLFPTVLRSLGVAGLRSSPPTCFEGYLKKAGCNYMSEAVVKGTFDEMCFFFRWYVLFMFFHNIYISYMSWKFFPDTCHFFFNLLNVSVSITRTIHSPILTSSDVTPKRNTCTVYEIYMYYSVFINQRSNTCRYIYISYIHIYVCSSGSTSILFILRHPCHFKALNVLLTKLGIGPVFMPWQLQYLKLHQCSHPCHKNLADWYQDLFPM